MSTVVPPIVVVMLTTGITNIMTQNVIYALPSKSAWIQSDAVIQTALSMTTTAFTDVAASTTGVHTSAPFIRQTNTSTGVTIMVKLIS